jgi:hypothetical protein
MTLVGSGPATVEVIVEPGGHRWPPGVTMTLVASRPGDTGAGRRAYGPPRCHHLQVTDLAVQPCRAVCEWRPAGRSVGPHPLHECRGCGSQWLATEGWTPVDADGTVPPTVLASRARARASGTGPTSGPDEGAAGTGGS